MTYRCAWCGSPDTSYHVTRYWEQDERGDEIEDTGREDLTPREDIWWCYDCDDAFIVPLVHEDGDE